jgi:NAD kinase
MSVDVTLAPGQSDTLLILDGQIDVPIVSGDAISVRRAAQSVYLVKYEGKSYFDILRERLMWEVKVEKRPD